MRLNLAARGGQPQWRRSRYCANTDCVEITRLNGIIMLRNSTHPRTVVRYTPQEWRTFTQGLLAGDFSDLE
jgi:hypothetical protein